LSCIESTVAYVIVSGRQQAGGNLWNRSLQQLLSGVGTVGYDPIVGALPPPMRLLVHWCVICGIASVPLLLSNSIECLTAQRVLLQMSFSLSVTAAVYVCACCVLDALCAPVSWPGGPRPHKIQRTPQWEDKNIPLPAIESWQHMCGEAAHKVSNSLFQVQLSGEPTGRDIWYNSESINSESIDPVVIELASGGRPLGFNPHNNPNRYVSRVYSLCLELT